MSAIVEIDPIPGPRDRNRGLSVVRLEKRRWTPMRVRQRIQASMVCQRLIDFAERKLGPDGKPLVDMNDRELRAAIFLVSRIVPPAIDNPKDRMGPGLYELLLEARRRHQEEQQAREALPAPVEPRA